MIDLLLWTITWCLAALIVVTTFTIMYMFFELADEIVVVIENKLKKLKK